MTKKLSIFALFLIFYCFSTNSQQFHRVFNAGNIITDSSLSAGGSWCDLNNDGFLDIYVAGDSNFMYLNNHNGTFTSITNGHFVKRTAFSITSVFADYDNDGDDDMYLANFTIPSGFAARNFLYNNSGFPSFNLDTVFIGNDINKSEGVNWVDYDYDGDLDLYVLSGGITSDIFYKNNGNNNFIKLTTLPFVRSRNGGQAVFVDYDNDNDLDLFIVNRGSLNELYKSFYKETNRVDSFSLISNSGLTDDGTIFDIGCNWGDYDNDGYLDVFLAVSGVFGAGLPDRLYHNNGNGTFTRVMSSPIVATGTNSSFGVWGDYDNDGDLDLFVAQVGINPTVSSLYRNDNSGNFVKMTNADVGDIIINLPAPQSGYWGDYDNDGDLDMFTANYSIPNNGSGRPQPNYLINNGLSNGNKFVFFKCKGTISNASAGGTKMLMYTHENSVINKQQRFVHLGTTSAFFQDDSRLHFGLGNSDIIDSAIIYWPSGIIEKYTNIQPNKFYVVTENSGITISIEVIGSHVPKNFKLYQNYPNPFNPVTNISCNIFKRSIVKITIYDLSGKEISTIVNKEMSPGFYSYQWDGNNFANGVYFYEITANNFIETKKMVLLK